MALFASQMKLINNERLVKCKVFTVEIDPCASRLRLQRTRVVQAALVV